MYIPEATSSHALLPSPRDKEAAIRDVVDTVEFSETIVVHVSAVSVIFDEDTTTALLQSTQLFPSYVKSTEYAFEPVDGSLPTATPSPQSTSPHPDDHDGSLVLMIMSGATLLALLVCVALLVYLLRRSWISSPSSINSRFRPNRSSESASVPPGAANAGDYPARSRRPSMHEVSSVSLRDIERLSILVNPSGRLLSWITGQLEDIRAHEIGSNALDDVSGRRTPDAPESIRDSEDLGDIGVGFPSPPPYTEIEFAC